MTLGAVVESASASAMPTPRVVAADWETDTLIARAAEAMTIVEWARLGVASAADVFTGARDPLKRRRDAAGDQAEPVKTWADRRRDVRTSRASRSFAEARSPALERVLVDDR